MNSTSNEYRPGVPHRPNVYVVCMHKAASTFVADVLLPSIAIRTAEYDLFNVGSRAILHKQKLLAEYGSNSPQLNACESNSIAVALAADPLPHSNQLVGRLYPRYLTEVAKSIRDTLPNPNSRMIVVRRDPRDALISYYYSKAQSHDTRGILSDVGKFQKERELLQSQSVRDGIHWMLGDAVENLVVKEFLTTTELVLDNYQVCDLPYELLINQPREWLTKFLAAGDLTRYVDEAWFEEMIAHLQPPAYEDPAKHKRRMRPGNWVDVFDDELRQLLADHVGIRMRIFGYNEGMQRANRTMLRAAA